MLREAKKSFLLLFLPAARIFLSALRKRLGESFIFFSFRSFQTASSSGDPHVHVIREVKATDEGLYTCIAGNVLGQATASAYLEVNSAITAAVSNLLLPLAFLAAMTLQRLRVT